MAIKGVFASDSNISGTRKGDFASAIMQLYPTGTAPFFAMSSGMQSADATDPVITWFEEAHLTGRHVFTADAAGTAAANLLSIDDSSDYVAGTVVLVETTGEYLYISSTPSSTSILVERGFAGTTIAAITGSGGSPYHCQLIGNAFEEGSNRPIGMANIGYPRFNYMQIFRNSWDVTRTAKKTEYYTGDIIAKNKGDCMIAHSEAIEKSMWFGKRTMGIRNGRTYRTMDGVLSQITTNITTAQATTTFDQMDAFIKPIFEKNIKGKPNERIAFCGNGVISVVNKITAVNTTMYIEPGETEFGKKIFKWISPYGDLTLMTHPLFVENPLWTTNLYVLHPGAVRVRYLDRTRTENVDKDGMRAGVDGDYGTMTTELSIEYKLEKTGGQFLGLTAGA